MIDSSLNINFTSKADQVLANDHSSQVDQAKTTANNPQLFEQILQDLLVPITSDSFQEVIGQVKKNLTSLNQILALLNETEFEGVLFNILQIVTLKIGELLHADRTTIFLLDETQGELWSILAQENQSKPFEIRIPHDRGIAGYVAQNAIAVNIPYDF